MRTIKFRAKNINDVWYYGSLVHSNELDPAIYFQTGKGSVKSMDWVLRKPRYYRSIHRTPRCSRQGNL